MKRIRLVVLVYSLVFALTGCAIVKEAGRSFAGISTKSLEERRKDGIVKKFDFDLRTCYVRIRNFLVTAGAYVYAEDAKKRLLAIYVSKEDTTPVGIFLTELSPASTQVEVSSASTYAKELIAGRVLCAFEECAKPAGEGG